MRPELLLEVLTRTGARVGRTSAGAIVTTSTPPELAAIVDAQREDLALAIAGRASGHRWAWCPDCGRAQLIATGEDYGCTMTPRCKGKLKAYATAKPPEPLLDHRGEPIPCNRQGCSNAAVTLTATLEPLCAPDLAHLATHQENT